MGNLTSTQPIVSETEFIESKKATLPVEVLSAYNSGNARGRICPYCKKGVYMKAAVIGGCSHVTFLHLEHFDKCEALHKMWLKLASRGEASAKNK